MCGIFGIQSTGNITQNEIISAHKMAATLKHRGPDEAGVYLDKNIIMGNTRLSIVDITGGSQPISNEDRSLWIVFNGEIFNYKELKRELIKKGHKFETSTDTEVILHLYEDQKSSCTEKLNGQFAFAIWDNVKKELFLARDRVGIVPLYYSLYNNRFIFASEIKSIFNSEDFPRLIDPQALQQVFTYWSTLSGSTIFKNIFEIPAGHYAKYSFGQFSLTKYWEPDFSDQFHERELNISQTEDEIKELLLDSIKLRMEADVTVGSYLSGGLDSSGFTSLIKRYFNPNIKTFSLSFEEKDFDELKYQNLMVDYLQTNHHNIKINNSDIAGHFTKAVYYSETPLLRTAPVPMLLLSKEVRKQDIKVIITGEGADEIFGGYNIFKETYIRYFQSRAPDSKYRAKLLKFLYPDKLTDRFINTLKLFYLRDIAKTNDPFFSHRIRWENTSRIKNFLKEDIQRISNDFDYNLELISILPAGFSKWDYFSKAQFLEMQIFMSNYLLSSQGDRMAMGNSVELRVPYLDHRLIEYMQKIPLTLKLRGLNEKYILKKILKPYLPKEIIARTKKPFRAPINSAFAAIRDFSIYNSNKEDLDRVGLFNSEKCMRLFQKLKSGALISETENMALSGIISTQILYSQFIENFRKEPEHKIHFNNYFDWRGEEHICNLITTQ